MPYSQQLFHLPAVDVMLWMSNHIALFYVNVITYPCLDPDADLPNVCQ